MQSDRPTSVAKPIDVAKAGGAARTVTGSIKQAVGKIIGDARTESEGAAEKAAGAKAAGSAKAERAKVGRAKAGRAKVRRAKVGG